AVVHSLSSLESYVFDMERPVRTVRTVAQEPHLTQRMSRAFVCGGMAGKQGLREGLAGPRRDCPSFTRGTYMACVESTFHSVGERSG
ncbi:hypothetical protein PAXINDRAFT_170620, partial [Paxillus involutus ATCC 200175]